MEPLERALLRFIEVYGWDAKLTCKVINIRYKTKYHFKDIEAKYRQLRGLGSQKRPKN